VCESVSVRVCVRYGVRVRGGTVSHCDVVSTPHTQHVNSTALPSSLTSSADGFVFHKHTTIVCTAVDQPTVHKAGGKLASLSGALRQQQHASPANPTQPHVRIDYLSHSDDVCVWAFINQTHILVSTPAQQQSLWAHKKTHHKVRIDVMHGKLWNAARRGKCQRAHHV
jgi:hypothetical protein